MILIGQFDSPFVRRVGVALRLYGIPFEHKPWSTFGDAAQVARYNPLMRVPTLVLDDGEVLIDSGAILDHLDEVVGADRALIPRSGAARRHVLKVAAMGTGLAEKSVSLLYERVLHQHTSQVWMERCAAQIAAVLDVLETARAARPTAYWFREAISHGDIAVACALRFTREAHTSVFDETRYPALAAHAARCEALPPFQEIAQTLEPPS